MTGLVVSIVGAAIFVYGLVILLVGWEDVQKDYDVEVEVFLTGATWQRHGRRVRRRWAMYRGADPTPVEVGYGRWGWTTNWAIRAAYMKRMWEK